MHNVVDLPTRSANRAVHLVATDESGVVPGEELAVRIYRRLLAAGPAEPVALARVLRVEPIEFDEALGVLARLRLIARDEQGAVRAMSPESARAELSLPLQQAIQRGHRELADVPQRLRAYADVFGSVHRELQRDIVVLGPRDTVEIGHRLTAAARECTSDVLVMRGNTDDADALVDIDALPEGVAVRVLCASGAQRAARDIGARMRVSEQVLADLVVVGDTMAFLTTNSDSDDIAVRIIADQVIVALLRNFYEQVWDAATEIETGSPASGPTDELVPVMAELLASGLKDEVIARRLGMSPRTFRRHLSSMMARLRAESRFQAGVIAAHAGLVGPGSGRDRLFPAC